MNISFILFVASLVWAVVSTFSWAAIYHSIKRNPNYPYKLGVMSLIMDIISVSYIIYYVSR